MINTNLAPVLYLPHGGGPLPLMNDPSHRLLIDFLKKLPSNFSKPELILIISAHWEEPQVSVTSNAFPELIYDYSGFPAETYQIKYPTRGEPKFAEHLFQLLHNAEIAARLDSSRGFDHGMFVPLKLMYPEADIPCVQLSLVKNLDPDLHLQIGLALAEIRQRNIMIIGSGFSFHNLPALMSHRSSNSDSKNEAFQNWVIDTCTNPLISRELRLKLCREWKTAPHADYSHPREEHLLPLHICVGIANAEPAEVIFYDSILGKKTCGLVWK